MRAESVEGYSAQVAWRESPLWQTQGRLLTRLAVELTERCNFECIHCYINQPAADQAIRRREMTPQHLKAILDEAAELGALMVRFTGGEPLLREDFEEIYLHARQQGLRVQLSTNGSLITPTLADLFARVPPLEKIEVTVYGMTPRSYQAVTGRAGAYEAVRRGVDLLLERGVPFAVRGTLLPPNEQELELFDAWATTLPGMERPPSQSVFLDLRARRDSPAKNRQIEALRRTPEAGLAVLNRRGEEYRQEMSEFCRRFMGPRGDTLFACGAGRSVCVDAYGKAQPCMLLRHPDTVYDLLEDQGKTPLRAALTDFFPRLRERRAEDPEYLARCARCFLYGLCKQCPANSWMEHGTLDTPVEYLCQVAHAQARDLGLLAEGESGWEVESSEWRKRVGDL